MKLATDINQTKQADLNLYYSLTEVDSSIRNELLTLIEDEQTSSHLNYQSLAKEQLQEQLIILAEKANRKAIKARNQRQFTICYAWEQVVRVIDLACESLETELSDSYYLIY